MAKISIKIIKIAGSIDFWFINYFPRFHPHPPKKFPRVLMITDYFNMYKIKTFHLLPTPDNSNIS